MCLPATISGACELGPCFPCVRGDGGWLTPQWGKPTPTKNQHSGSPTGRRGGWVPGRDPAPVASWGPACPFLPQETHRDNLQSSQERRAASALSSRPQPGPPLRCCRVDEHASRSSSPEASGARSGNGLLQDGAYPRSRQRAGETGFSLLQRPLLVFLC